MYIPPDHQQLFEEAERYWKLGDVYHAVKLHKRIIKLVPDWHPPYLALARIYHQRREWKPSFYYFKNQKALDTYVNSELWNGIVTHPNLINFKTDSYGIASISDLSNGNAAIRNTEKIKAPEGMSVLVVNYELEDMTLEAHAELGSEVVSNFSPGKIDGLIGKTFIGNVENGVFGGVYYFKNQDDLNNYLNSDLWKGIVTHPNLVNFKTDIYEVASIFLFQTGFQLFNLIY